MSLNLNKMSRGICPTCQKNISLEQSRVKHHQIYYHSSCFGQLQTGYSCPHCDKPTQYRDQCIIEIKNIEKTIRGNEPIIGYYHLKCLYNI
jgi:endogenous inhibitor of DNA gyrase (YacG/DUF329 family)